MSVFTDRDSLSLSGQKLKTWMFPWIVLLQSKADKNHKVDFRAYLWPQPIPTDYVICHHLQNDTEDIGLSMGNIWAFKKRAMTEFRSQRPRIYVTWLEMGLLVWMTSKGWTIKDWDDVH